MISYYAGNDTAALATLHTAVRFSPLTPSWFTYYMCWASMWSVDLATARKSGTAYLAAEPNEPYGYVMLSTLASFEGDEVTAATWIRLFATEFPTSFS